MLVRRALVLAWALLLAWVLVLVLAWALLLGWALLLPWALADNLPALRRGEALRQAPGPGGRRRARAWRPATPKRRWQLPRLPRRASSTPPRRRRRLWPKRVSLSEGFFFAFFFHS